MDTSQKINLKNDVLKFMSHMANYINIRGDKYWDFNAYHDFTDTKQEQDFVIIQSFEDFGEYNITPKYDVKDEYEILISYAKIELDLFQNNIEIPISNKPVISPLSPGSRTYYKYDYWVYT